MGQCCSERDPGTLKKIVEEEKVKLGEGGKAAGTTFEEGTEAA